MAGMSLRRMLRLSLALGLVAIVWAPAAWAHARLVRTSPAAGAVVAHAPTAVRVTFDDRVWAMGGNDVVRNSNRRSVLDGPARVTGNGKILVLPLRAKLPDGAYSVRWRILSDDGHPLGGAFAFRVGKGGAPPASVLTAPGGRPKAEDVVARWLLYAGLLVAAGAAMLSFVVPRRTRQLIDPRRRLALLFGGSMLYLAGAADLLHGTSVDTRFGTALAVGIAVAGIAAVAALASVYTRWALLVAIVAALALIPIPTVAGHALDSGVDWPNIPFDIAHIAAAAAWVGVLTALVIGVPRALQANEDGDAFPRFLARVSTVALVSVVVLAGTGVLRTIFELRNVQQLWTTGYGRALLVKIALLLALVVIGWVNRRSLPAVERVRRNTAVELVLLAGVIVAVAFLTQLRPGRDAPRSIAAPASAPPRFLSLPKVAGDALVVAQPIGRYAVAVAVRPSTVDVLALAPSGSAANGLRVRVDDRPTESCGHGCYRMRLATPSPRLLRVSVGDTTSMFALPRHAAPGAEILSRAGRAFRSLRSVAYLESLASSPTNRIVTSWRLEAPDRVAYAIRGGADGIVIGAHRWDRAPGEPWRRSISTPLDEPRPVWGTRITNARVLETTPRTVTLAWANPSIPAWFTASFDRRTFLPHALKMTAAAHFMHHRYVEFNGPRRIRPPTR
jgi:copper transport protein